MDYETPSSSPTERGADTCTPFRLENTPPKPKPLTFESSKDRQRVLFTGLDCLPGQQDLFDCDGEPSIDAHDEQPRS